LTVVNRQTHDNNSTSLDPIADFKQYGVIMNPDVRRRANFKPDTLKQIARENITAANNPPSVKQEVKSASKSNPQTQGKGGALFSSFAKAKPKVQNVEKVAQKPPKEESST
jgi:hypothetical protein